MWIKGLKCPFLRHSYGKYYLWRILKSPAYPVTDLEEIARLSVEKQVENDHFATFVNTLDSQKVDQTVHALNITVTGDIDCTACGNCCKSLMINISEPEADRVADHLQVSRAGFDSRYIEKGSHGRMVINTIPCHFLHHNRCSIYEYRFEGCREFPALHLPGFHKRLFTIFMHYGRCPIIFNVVEILKEKLQFARQTH